MGPNRPGDTEDGDLTPGAGAQLSAEANTEGSPHNRETNAAGGEMFDALGAHHDTRTMGE